MAHTFRQVVHARFFPLAVIYEHVLSPAIQSGVQIVV
jgi:hypothetical protein